jgi:hypothetical protein
VRAAWLRFPNFQLEPLAQVYRRVDAETYRYESAGGRFVTELRVNAAGLIISYPNQGPGVSKAVSATSHQVERWLPALANR